MKIPKYIDKLIDRRCRLAEELNKVDSQLSEWCEKNGIDTYTDYLRTGILIYSEPSNAAYHVREDIENL